ncbi:MAG TPA: hypothetical protein VGJ04_01985 [Pirellulales bacterium]
MIRSALKENKKHSNHTSRNRNGYAQTERDILATVRGMGSEAKQSLQRRAADFKESAADYVSQGRKQIRAIRRSAKRRVKQNPKAALCMAAGLGLLLGCCLRRRK